MSVFYHWKMILGLVAIFVTGILVGFVIVFSIVHHAATHPVLMNAWVDARVGELNRRLKLTPEQKQKIRPIVEKAGLHIREIVGHGLADFAQTERDAHDELIKELTPEQQQKMDKMRDDIRKHLRDLVNREYGKVVPKQP